jgi:hypothetical protein
MPDLDDDQFDEPEIELLKTPAEAAPPVSRQRRTAVWIALAVLLAAIAVAAYIVFRSPSSRPAQTAAQASRAPAHGDRPLGGVAENVVVPSLDESDPAVRRMVAEISSHPRVAAWLATSGLIRGFAVIVTNVAEGTTPAAHLAVFRPTAQFSVVERQGARYIDPRSYGRYDSLAAAMPSIDPAGAARVYATLKPRLEEAYRDLGAPDGTFDRALERGIVSLLQTPVIDAPIRVEQEGVGYRFAAPELEALTPAQKQLLRTGPGNVRSTQASLRRIALALGIPAERLPPPKD